MNAATDRVSQRRSPQARDRNHDPRVDFPILVSEVEQAADWLDFASYELADLTAAGVLDRVEDADPGDAWRAVVLIARLLASPAGPVPSRAVLDLLPRVLCRAAKPDLREVFLRLAYGLRSDEDPAGTLLDALHDLGDLLTVLQTTTTRHGQASAASLAELAAGQVLLYPGRVASIAHLASVLIETLRDDQPAATLWRAIVESAPPVDEAGP